MNLNALWAQLFGARNQSRPQPGADIQEIVGNLAPDRLFTIVDIGAQNLAGEQHVYSPLCVPEVKHRIIGFEPLEHRASERSADESGAIIYPVAIGDGSEQTLYINNDDATSSIYQLDEEFCSAFEHLNTLKLASKSKLKTSRLDDVLPPEPVEFLKLDIQGAELMALENGLKVLGRTAVIHCEVEFDQIYRNQPLFHDVSKLLAEQGFYLVDLLISHRYYYKNSLGAQTADRLLWADAVFFRSSTENSVLEAQAVISARVYDKRSLAAHLLDQRS
ncbi:MAG: FkbM family methyltransferase [Methylocystis sp.]|nr:FkbM family methyltransferase [Methylocystis sp.]